MPEKEVALDKVPVSMSKSQSSVGFEKCIVSKYILARLVGNDLEFTVDALEQIVFDDRKRITFAFVTGANADGLVAIAVSQRTIGKVISGNGVIVRFRRVAPDNNSDP